MTQNKTALEVEKLREEINNLKADRQQGRLDRQLKRLERQRLRADIRWLGKNRLLQSVGAAFSGLATLTAVLGLVVTMRAQQKQFALASEDRRRTETEAVERRFAEAAKQFTEAKDDRAKIASIQILQRFAREAPYRQQVRNLVLGVLIEERSLNVRAAFQGLLLQNPDTGLVRSLTEQNLLLQSLFVEHSVLPSAPIGSRFPLDENASKRDSARRDSVERSLQDLDQDLEWNVSTLIKTINLLHGLKNLSLRGIILSRYGYEDRPSRIPGERAEAFILVHGREGFDPGLVFENVDMRNAVLIGRRFTSVAFNNVNLDSAYLASAAFYDVTFSGNSSMREFQTTIPISREVVAGESSSSSSYWPQPVEFAGSRLDLAAFYPHVDAIEESVSIHYFFLTGCSWHIRSSAPTEVTDIVRLPVNAGRNNQTVDSDDATYGMNPKALAKWKQQRPRSRPSQSATAG